MPDDWLGRLYIPRWPGMFNQQVTMRIIFIMIFVPYLFSQGPLGHRQWSFSYYSKQDNILDGFLLVATTTI